MKVAYFDFDGTIVKTNSLHYLVTLRSFKLMKDPGFSSLILWIAAFALLPLIVILHLVWERARDIVTYRLYYGLTLTDIRDGMERYWSRRGQEVFHESVLSLIHEAFSQGYRVVLVSGSHQLVVESALRLAGVDGMVDAYITTDFQVGSDQTMRGRLIGGPNIQDRKVVRIKVYEDSLRVRPSTRMAVSDSSSDLPLLFYCERSCVIKPKRKLKRLAVRNSWTILPHAKPS